MIDFWLKTCGIILFACWILILIAMGKVKPRPIVDDQLEESSSFFEVTENIENDETLVLKGEEEELVKISDDYSLSKWEDVLASEEQCSLIIQNAQWEDNSLNYAHFLKQCEDKQISIVDVNEIALHANNKILHFDDCNLMPLIWEKNYSIQAVNGKTLEDIFKSINPFSLIIISVKDDGTQALNHRWQEKLHDLGIRALTRDFLHHSYINIIWKKYEYSYLSLFEECSPESLHMKYEPDELIGLFKAPAHIEVISEGFSVGNSCSIKIDGQEYAKNERGMNIVVYDLLDSKVSVIYRVDTFVTLFEDTTIYRALLNEEEENVS